LAQKTGWPIDYVLWEIPISLINQANHTYLWMAGANTKRVTRADSDNIKEIATLLNVKL
jgi:hypothetical protein